MQKMPLKLGYQLVDSPFYKLKSRARLARLLRISTETLDQLSTGRMLYARRWKHKKLEQWLCEPPSQDAEDSYRPIDIPDPRLKAVQSRIASLLSRIHPPDFLFSPVKGRSYVQNAAFHVGSEAFWLLDVTDYFPSCTANNVARFFRADLDCSPDVSAILVRLTTLREFLPQGSPCSPILAYYCNRPMWLSVEKIVTDAGCKLSLYADDITISGDVVRKRMIWEVKKTVYGSGLRLKTSKEVSLIKSAADITGVIVKFDGTYLPNRQFKKLAELKALHSTTVNSKDKARIENQIAGRVAQRRQVESFYTAPE